LNVVQIANLFRLQSDQIIIFILRLTQKVRQCEKIYGEIHNNNSICLKKEPFD